MNRICGVIFTCSTGVLQIVGSSLSLVKPKSVILKFASSPLSTQYKVVRAKTGCLGNVSEVSDMSIRALLYASTS